jgi:hypothetical protein
VQTSDATSHAQRAQHALLWAAASADSSSVGSHAERAQNKLLAAANADAGDSAFIWAVQQLRTAAEQYVNCSSMSTARAAFARVLCNAAGTFAVDCADDAAAALLAALPQLLLPVDLAAQVLVQTLDMVPAAVWADGLHATAAAAGVSGSGAVLQLLFNVVQESQLQLRVNVKGPAVYAEVVMAAAELFETDVDQAEQAVGQLLRLMLMGEQAADDAAAATAAAFCGVPLAASAAAQLVVELSRRRTPSSSSYGNDDEQAAAARQLLVVGAVAPAILRHYSSSSSSSISVLINGIAGQLYQTALLPQLYLTMLLQPHVSSEQWITLVRQSGLTSGNTPQAAAGLALLCTTLKPGKNLPIAAYATLLAAALDIVSTDSINAAYPEARIGLELEKRQRQQQLLAAVVAVLGTFRGMRVMHASPLGAQVLLPIFDLAAVLCYCQELLPGDAAASLAAAVARALGQAGGSSSSSQELVQLLAQLPNAAAAWFGKGAELWLLLLQQMAVAGGLSDAEAAELVAKLKAVAAQQGLAQLPVRIAPMAGRLDGELSFADPAAAAAARGGAGTATTAAAAAASAGVTSHPVPVTAADSGDTSSDEDTDANSSTFAVTENALEVIAAVSLSVASTAATAALAAGYGAAGALVGLVWGAAAMTAGALAVSGSDACSTKEEAAAAAAAATAKEGEAVVSPPDSPRTPTIHDAALRAAAAKEASAASSRGSSSSITGSHRAAMGGRTKAPAPAPAAAPAAALGYAGSAMAAGATAAAAGAGAGQGSGVGFASGLRVLGSLAVDPDEVVKKIRSQSAHMPLDEAVMQVRIIQYASCTLN